MNYLMLVCSENAPIPSDADTASAMGIDDWVALCGKSRIYGEALKAPSGAKTVRVRNGQTLISDGPYTETKEFVAGFDLLACDDLDAAIALAAAHPVTAARMVELRPFPDELDYTGVREALEASETGEGRRFMFMICVDGIPEAEEVEARLLAESMAWGQALSDAGKMPFGNGLAGIDTATTVRRRSGQTLLSDGPFAETKEFLAGIAVLQCADLDEAVVLAARHPLAAYHRVEVREMFAAADWEAMEAA
jgi:hypothetical protein